PIADLLSGDVQHCELLSFPTRRSSDLRIYLPPTERAEPVVAAPAAEPAISKGGETILVAEDDERVRNTIVALLQQRGYRVLEARSEEHTSELQSRSDLVCRLLLENKKP